MYQERKKLGFEILISDLFSNLGRLILVNLIFAVPFLFSVAISWALYKLVLPIFIVVMPLSLVLASPFYAGVVQLARDYSQNLKPDRIFKTFFKAVKSNGLRFLLIGILFYAAILGCFFGIRVYSVMAAQISGFFYVLLFFMILIAVFFWFFFLAVPLMSVSFELKTKDAFKNSALMTFGEFKKNFFATIGVLAYLAVVLFPIISILYMSSFLSVAVVKTILIAYTAVSLGVLIPAPCAMIISHYLYPNMKAVIAGEGVPSFDVHPRKTNVSDVKTEEITPSPEDIRQLEKGDGDEYIFYQGKMIKRKILLKMLKEKENNHD